MRDRGGGGGSLGPRPESRRRRRRSAGVESQELPRGDSVSKSKHRQEHEDEEDCKALPRKKQKVPGKPQHMGIQHHLKPKYVHRKRDPPAYAAGSPEEQWYLEILDRGRVTCPTCRAVVRKTVEGLKKHMANCQQEMFTCHHCGKQLRSLAGMKYHTMADHNSLPFGKEVSQQGEQSERGHLRRVLKRMGKLKCTRQGCGGSFTSIMGYLYHTQKCGKAAGELEEMALKCHHCGKAYQSKAGLAYHLKSEHGPVLLFCEDGQPTHRKEANAEPSSGGRRVQRKSAKVAAYYLHELANEELVKEWPKRKVLQDLVPDDRKLKYTRPGLPTIRQEVLCKWRSDIKLYRRVHCPNQGCECVYSSISGLKSHLGSCTWGEFVAGKYRCLLCEKEFASESGVKYHINSVHAEDWFDVNSATTQSFGKLLKLQPKDEDQKRRQPKKPLSDGSRKRRQRAGASPKKASPRLGAAECLKAGCPQLASGGSEEDPGPPPLKLAHRRGRKWLLQQSASCL
ncbi:zinc finger protein 512 isoform X2 [Rhineura floridana]|uniref:zinc finger protein 512 isoform X2 n=1 Tax=Rhineura floridana TaxID=261503 RepID=UPI002AC82CDF|nr:zinc finger protein 512 isoform X2 [Rhineura floridana]